MGFVLAFMTLDQFYTFVMVNRDTACVSCAVVILSLHFCDVACM